MDNVVELKCQNCGSKLQVYDDMDRFPCSYCATELIAQRRGGTILLKRVAEAIEGVKLSSDKTAAELSIARLNNELAQLKSQKLRAWVPVSSPSVDRRLSLLFAAGFAIVGILLLPAGGFGIVPLFMSGFFLWKSKRHGHQAELARPEYEAKAREIEKKEREVNAQITQAMKSLGSVVER